MQITYQKSNGCIIKRLRSTPLGCKIGDTTSMGWKVLNIEYQYKNKYYPEYKYNMLILKNKQAFIKKKEIRELCIRELRTLLYCLISIILLKLMLGI